MAGRIERGIEHLLFRGRWLMVPGYLGLIVTLALISIRIVEETVHTAPLILEMKDSELILATLNVIDLSLAGNLILMVVFAGYENFISKIGFDDHEDRPAWMEHVDFSELKLKLISSIVAISAIELLKSYMELEQYDRSILMWKLGIHLGFVISGVMLALMDRIVGSHRGATADRTSAH